MFEQTFVTAAAQDRKPYTVLISLLIQITCICALILVPLVYTQVLPQARLRSVFAAPTPPPPALPKAPPTLRNIPISRTALLIPPINTPALRAPQQHFEPPAGLAPEISTGATGGDPFSNGPTLEALNIKPPEPAKPPAPKPNAPQRLRVTTLDPSQLLYRVQPVYPQMAKNIRVQGTVEFTAIISKSGTIENLQLVHGHPLLIAAAKEAILQWRYKPTLLNGEPVEVITNIVVNFTLNER